MDEFRRLSEGLPRLAAGRWDGAYAASTQALDLWRGQLLADLADEAWVAAEAARLDEPRGRCSEVQVTALLGQSRIPEAVDRSRDLVESYPLREHTRWLRMVALHRAGRSPEALEAYHDYARRLNDELGLRPGPELRDLQTAILRHDPSLAVWPVAPDQAAVDGERGQHGESRRAAASTSAADPPAIVGRGEELSTIGAVLADVIAGRNRWLLLCGPAGDRQDPLGRGGRSPIPAAKSAHGVDQLSGR